MKTIFAALLFFFSLSAAKAADHASVSESLRSARAELCQVSGDLEDMGRTRPKSPNAAGGTEWLVKADSLAKAERALETKIAELKSQRKQLEVETPSLRQNVYARPSTRCELVNDKTVLCNGQHFSLDKSGKVIETVSKTMKQAPTGDDGEPVRGNTSLDAQ